MTRRTYASIPILTLLVALIVRAVAPAQDGAAERPPDHMLLDSIRGAILETAGAEAIGPVDDLIIDSRTNTIAFAIVSTGRYIGEGERLTAVPYRIVQWKWKKDSRSFVPAADVDVSKISSAPRYQHAKLTELLASEEWRRATERAFGCCPSGSVMDAGVETPASAAPEKSGRAAWRRISSMTTMTVDTSEVAKNDDGTEKITTRPFGVVENLVIDREGRKIAAILVRSAGVVDVDVKRFVVPCTAARPERGAMTLRLNRSAKRMTKAPRVGKDDVIARLGDADYRRELATFYSEDAK